MKTLHSDYASQGLEIVAVPSTQFNQEYKTNDELLNYIREKEIAFTVLGLADVNGPQSHPLYVTEKGAAQRSPCQAIPARTVYEPRNAVFPGRLATTASPRGRATPPPSKRCRVGGLATPQLRARTESRGVAPVHSATAHGATGVRALA